MMKTKTIKASSSFRVAFFVMAALCTTTIDFQTNGMDTTKPHHEGADLSCTDCHGAETPDSPPRDLFFCVKCHDLEELISRTETEKVYKSTKINPHKTPHGKLAGCTFCHREHSASQFYCSGCHSFRLETP